MVILIQSLSKCLLASFAKVLSETQFERPTIVDGYSLCGRLVDKRDEATFAKAFRFRDLSSLWVSPET